MPLPPAIRDLRRASLPPTALAVMPGGPVSSFDPPLSRGSAALLAAAAVLVFLWVLYAAAHAPARKTVSTVETAGSP